MHLFLEEKSLGEEHVASRPDRIPVIAMYGSCNQHVQDIMCEALKEARHTRRCDQCPVSHLCMKLDLEVMIHKRDGSRNTVLQTTAGTRDPTSAAASSDQVLTSVTETCKCAIVSFDCLLICAIKT